MQPAYNRNEILEGVRLIFKNFEGKEDDFNRDGMRNFCVLLDPETADRLKHDGWNVKFLKSMNDEPPQAYLPVALSYRNPKNPPIVVLITGRNRTNLDQDMVDILDWVDMENVDLIIRPRDWAQHGRSGIKAYLKSIYVTVHVDRLAKKYEDFDELPSAGGQTYEMPELEAGSRQHYDIEGELAED